MHRAFGDADARGTREAVRRVLVHAKGAREHAAAYERQVRGLEKRLRDAVLAALAVQHRQHHVDGDAPERAVGEVLEQATLLAGNQHHGQHVVGRPGVALAHVGLVSGVVQPRAVARDADELELVVEPVELGKDVGGGAQRDVVLGGGAAKQHGDAEVLAHRCSNLEAREPDGHIRGPRAQA